MTTFNIEWEPQGELQNSAGPNGLIGTLDWTRTANFTASDPNWSEADVSAASGCPRIGDSHPQISYARLVDRNIAKLTVLYGKIVCKYSAPTIESGGGDQNPLNMPTVKSWHTISSEEAIDEDVTGKPIATITGEPLNGVKETFYDLALTCKKNFAAFDPVVFYAYIGTTNSTTFLGFPVGTVKLVDIQAQDIIGKDFSYVEISATFQMRKPLRTTNARAWWKRLKHEGFYRFPTADIKLRVPCLDNNKEPVTQPAFIKPDGTQETDTTIGHWIEFRTLAQSDFNALNFF